MAQGTKLSKAETKILQAEITMQKAVKVLSDMFMPTCKLSIIMRNPNDINGYMIVTQDTAEGLIELLETHKDKIGQKNSIE